MYASQRENILRMKERTNEQKKHIKLEKYQQQQRKKSVSYKQIVVEGV